MLVCIAMLASAGLVHEAAAEQFIWSQNGGFVMPGADPNLTLRAGQLFGTNAAPLAAHGGLEFFDLQAVPAPANTFRVISWGCETDGNSTGGVTNCANGGTALNAQTLVDPTPAPGVNGRSLLVLDVFDSSDAASGGVLDSATGNPVVIARIHHLNRIVDNEANALKAITISTNLVVNGNPGVPGDLNSIPIGFLETNNDVASAAGCTQTPNPLGSICDDQFTFDVSGFTNVPFTHNGKNFFLQFSIAPLPECSQDITGDPNAVIRIFQCSDNPAHRVAFDFAGGRAWAMEGFDNGLQVTMRVTEQPVQVPGVLFVIGDVEPHGIGDVVNFWGAQWWKNNDMSGFVSNGVASFKGFATQADNFCGGTWQSRPGNSSNPPATIPDFVAIIVTDTVVKNGPNISGNIKEIVIVQHDGNYGPNPGHRGGGPVTTIVCQSDSANVNETRAAARTQALAFFDSPEYLSQPVTLASHVTLLYERLLGRSPDAPGLAGWVGRLQADYDTALPGFVNSQEFRSLVPNLQDRPAVGAVVSRLYKEVLGRTPDAAEAGAWTDYVVATGDLLGVARGFFDSAEYNGTPRTLAQHVVILYRTFLGREPAPAEVGPWVDYLQSFRMAVAKAFVGSPE
jgi:hypothetical protein